VRVVYVSPLKALSADIHKNLGAAPRIRAVRRSSAPATADHRRGATGDTSPAERGNVCTPLHPGDDARVAASAADGGAQPRHVADRPNRHRRRNSRRDWYAPRAHLALSLNGLAESPLLRIGLSATQNPVEEVARFLVGTAAVDASGSAACAIVDEGHRRNMDLGLELPRSSLEAVMSNEVWEEYYQRLAELIEQHRTTLVFVNTRRLAERVARHLSERLGDGRSQRITEPVRRSARRRNAAKSGS
jgi:ATP-dependent Lhr-like helicase